MTHLSDIDAAQGAATGNFNLSAGATVACVVVNPAAAAGGAVKMGKDRNAAPRAQAGGGDEVLVGSGSPLRAFGRPDQLLQRLDRLRRPATDRFDWPFRPPARQWADDGLALRARPRHRGWPAGPEHSRKTAVP